MYTFSKAKLPQGLSFPLKRSILDAALAEAGISKVANVYYSLAQRTNAPVPVVRSDYLSEAKRAWSAAGTASITVHAVPSEQRAVVEAAIRETVLPALIRWLAKIERAGSGPRAMDQSFTASWLEGKFAVRSS